MKDDTVLKKIVEAPSIIIEKTEEKVAETTSKLTKKSGIRTLQQFWKSLGPGLVSGAADDDPSGIATYSQTGAKYGFGLLWLSVFTFPMMSVVQETCARIALVSGRGLAANMKRVYGKKVLFFATALLFIANTFNIGADLGAMAKSVELVFPKANFWLVIIFFGIGGLLLEIFISYKNYAKYLKWITIVLFSYIVTLIIIQVPFGTLISNLFSVSITGGMEEVTMIVAILGTTISPYLFFWQSGQEVEEEIAEGKVTIKERVGVSASELKRMRVDVWTGMFFSNFVMFSIIAVCATTLFANGIHDIGSAEEAALALKPFAGNAAYVLFALGVIGTGLLAIPVLAGSTAYAIAETFGWKEGLNKKLPQARAFYGVIIISIVAGIALNAFGVNPIKGLVYAAILNGIVAPVILFFIMRLGSNKKIMGTARSKPLTVIVGWATTFVMASGALYVIISYFLS